MRGLPDAAEPVALHDALESFSFGNALHIDEFAFREHVNRQDIAQFILIFELQLNDFFLRDGARFLEVACGRLRRALLAFVIETQLQRFIPVDRCGSDLGNDTRPGLYDGARDVFPVLVKDAGHADFSSD
jgi:hypothetical protein